MIYFKYCLRLKKLQDIVKKCNIFLTPCTMEFCQKPNVHENNSNSLAIKTLTFCEGSQSLSIKTDCALRTRVDRHSDDEQ